MINVFLAEDHNIVRNGIKSLLENNGEIAVIGEANNGLGALNMPEKLAIADVLLTDINMAGIDGITLTKELAKNYPNLAVVILTMLDQENYVFGAFTSGAKAYLLKNVSTDELVFCIKHIAAGGTYFCSELSMKMLRRLMDSNHPEKQKSVTDIEINGREMEMLNMLIDGYTNQEMADKLFVSKRTIEGYRQHLIEKTKSKNTASLIKFCIANGIIKL